MKNKKKHEEKDNKTDIPLTVPPETETASAEATAPAEEESEQADASLCGEQKCANQETEQKYNELLDRYQRTLAEFDNYRKRTQKEKAVIYDDGIRDAVEKLLPVIDNFERAINAGENKEDKFYQGVVMIAKQLGAYLSDLGVEPIAAGQGETFNPNQHFAVAHVEDENFEANVIMDELQKGYKYKEKVIRPSMVRVAN